MRLLPVATLPQSKTMQYIGVSRGIQQSLRLHLARRPTQTYFFKVTRIFRHSLFRVRLELRQLGHGVKELAVVVAVGAVPNLLTSRCSNTRWGQSGAPRQHRCVVQASYNWHTTQMWKCSELELLRTAPTFVGDKPLVICIG